MNRMSVWFGLVTYCFDQQPKQNEKSFVFHCFHCVLIVHLFFWFATSSCLSCLCWLLFMLFSPKKYSSFDVWNWLPMCGVELPSVNFWVFFLFLFQNDILNGISHNHLIVSFLSKCNWYFCNYLNCFCFLSLITGILNQKIHKCVCPSNRVQKIH